MAQIVLSIAGDEIAIECSPQEERRVADLAASLEARLAAIPDSDRRKALILAALALIDENQGARASLARAHQEIERLFDALEAAKAERSPPLGV